MTTLLGIREADAFEASALTQDGAIDAHDLATRC